MTKLKILLFDIETAPSLGWAWGKYEQTILSFEKHWYMLSFSAKWFGTNKHITYALPDFPMYQKNPEDDSQLVAELWKLLDEADIVIAHNGDSFDIKKSNTRFMINSMTPPSPYKTIDTLKLARKYFAFESNRLNDLAIFLGMGSKVHTGGFALWTKCMKGDTSAWNKMKQYNKQDVNLLEKVYLKLRSWSTNHTKVVVDSIDDTCNVCGSANVQRRGFNYTKIYKYQRYVCMKCGAWSQGKLEKKTSNV